CSVFSGVGDLQGGTAGAKDSGAPPAPPGNGKDASPAADAHVADTGGPPGGTCGASKCDPRVPCCVDLTSRARSCGDTGGCPGGVALVCTSSAECAADSGKPMCCFSLTAGMSCEATCDTPGSAVLCDPNAPNSCPDGKTCKSEPVFGGFSVCR